MNPGFKIFSQSVREEVARRFEESDQRVTPIKVEYQGRIQQYDCCPIGALMLLDGLLVPGPLSDEERKYSANKSIFKTYDLHGEERYPVAPSGWSIPKILLAAYDTGKFDIDEDDSVGGIASWLRQFYNDWDSRLIDNSGLRAHLLEGDEG